MNKLWGRRYLEKTIGDHRQFLTTSDLGAGLMVNLDPVSPVVDYETPESCVSDEDVGAHPKDKTVYSLTSGGGYYFGKLVRRSRFEKQVGRAANFERGQGGEVDILKQAIFSAFHL